MREKERERERYKVEMCEMYASFVWHRVVSGGLYILCVKGNDADGDGNATSTARQP